MGSIQPQPLKVHVLLTLMIDPNVWSSAKRALLIAMLCLQLE